MGLRVTHRSINEKQKIITQSRESMKVWDFNPDLSDSGPVTKLLLLVSIKTATVTYLYVTKVFKM